MITQARADAREVVARDPELADHPEIRLAADQWVAPEQAEFLDKG